MLNRLRASLFERFQLPFYEFWYARQLEQRFSAKIPRFAFVKQDVQDDLYCCASSSSPRDIVASTLMRTGPVALFTRCGAEFILLRTEPDEECGVWEQRCTELHWVDRDRLVALQACIPGRDYGQSKFTRAAGDVDWESYDIVISLDVSVPARITRQHTGVVWCYYVREPKTSAYSLSRGGPLPGQDLFLNQGFQPVTAVHQPHEIHFPYYLQYYGCYHELFDRTSFDSRRGVFLEHQTAGALSPAELHRVAEFGRLQTTAVSLTPNGELSFRDGYVASTMTSEERVRGLMSAKYFAQLGAKRHLWGNAFIEAIAAGALAVGNPDMHTHSFIFTEHTAARTFDELMMRLTALETDAKLYERELARQRRLVDFLCFTRPMLHLLNAADRLRTRRA